jgi:hypothetical protein
MMNPAVGLEAGDPVAGKLRALPAVDDPTPFCTRSNLALGASRVDIERIGPTSVAREPLHVPPSMERLLQEVLAFREGSTVVIARAAVETADPQQRGGIHFIHHGKTPPIFGA